MKTSTKLLILGGIFIGLIGPILHFAFEWTNWLPLAIFAPVNESPWEHTKLLFWPAVWFLVVEFAFLYRKEEPKNFFFAKTVGILVMPLAMLGLFYGYSLILGTNTLMADIIVFYIAIILGQLVSYKLYSSNPVSATLNRFSILALLGFALLVAVFVFYPPQIPLFYDTFNGGYGIIASI